jgi:hypothetical protein
MSDDNKPKKTIRKNSSQVKFVSDKHSNGGSDPRDFHETNLANLTAAVTKDLSNKLSPDYMHKSIVPLKPSDGAKRVDKNKVSFNSRNLYATTDNIENKGWHRINDSESREISQIDPYISAIISTRASQGAVIGRRSESKYDKGTRVAELKPLQESDFPSLEEFEKASKRRQNQMAQILDWFLTCGTPRKEFVDEAYDGVSDSTFKTCSLADFVSSQVRNLLTFGRMGTQLFRDDSETIVMFRPAPIETIYPVISGKPVSEPSTTETAPSSLEDVKDYNALAEEERPPAWVQQTDGVNVNFYTERDMRVSYFQKQALFDLKGFPLSPIEQAVFMVFVHQQTLGYLRNQYVKGMAAKGVISLESLNTGVGLSDEDLEQLRRDFHNYITRNDNSAAIPVISGPVKVGFTPMSTNPSDMQFLELEEHIVRALCSAFQISPQEMGYGHLSVGQGGLNQSNKQTEITQGEERGLRMLLDSVYDLLNEILYENFPETSKLYRLVYTGVGDDTRDTVIQRNQQELQTTATMASLWADSEKTETIPLGGSVPLAPLFHANVVKYMKYGEFMERFFGEDGASKRPEYDFIIDPNLNQAYQTLKTNPVKAQQEQTQLQITQQHLQLEQMEAQTRQMEQQGQAAANGELQSPEGSGVHGDAVPGQDQQQGQDQQDPQQDPQQAQEQQEAPPEEAEKSLKDVYLEKQRLQKSAKTYFSEWILANNDFESKIK